MIQGRLQNVGDVTEAENGVLILVDTASVAMLVLEPSNAGANFSGVLELSTDLGETWVTSDEFDQDTDMVERVRIARAFQYRIRLTAAVSVGSLRVSLAG